MHWAEMFLVSVFDEVQIYSNPHIFSPKLNLIADSLGYLFLLELSCSD